MSALLVLIEAIGVELVNIIKAGDDEDARHAAVLRLNRITADEIAKRELG